MIFGISENCNTGNFYGEPTYIGFSPVHLGMALGSRGAPQHPPSDQIFHDFMQFSGNFNKIVSQRPLNEGWRLLQENPGSATGFSNRKWVMTLCSIENLSILSEASLNKLENFQLKSALSYIKYPVLFLRHMYWLFIYASKLIFSSFLRKT